MKDSVSIETSSSLSLVPLGARKIMYCKKCIMPDTRPRIRFDKEGICNACRYAEEKKGRIDWQRRNDEFKQLLDKYRRTDGYWDCIVPWSGGKDSTANAIKLKFEYGMNPLLVTFNSLITTEVGAENRNSLLDLGFDHIYFVADRRVMRKLSRKFFIERGNPKAAWDAGVNSVPVRVATQYGIPLIFYSEHGESEYGGNKLHDKSDQIRDLGEVLENQIGDDPVNWTDEDIKLNDLAPYLYPSLEDVRRVGVVATYMGYYFKWDQWSNYHYVKKYFDFKLCKRGRTIGTFTNHDSLDDKMDDVYYYMQYIKFGFGRAIRDASRMIQNGHLTRQKGLEYARKYDGEFPEEVLDDVLKYMYMSRDEFIEIVDKHRNPEIWTKESGEWKLRFPVQ